MTSSAPGTGVNTMQAQALLALLRWVQVMTACSHSGLACTGQQ